MSGKRSEHQQRVDQFMRRAKQELPEKPMLPDEKTRLLRAKLILEEAFETIQALGFDVVVNDEYELEDKASFNSFVEISPSLRGRPADLEGIADGCADIAVVTTGTLSSCGISDYALQKEVDDNNLAKFGPGHSWNADGKLIKPPDHKPPDIARVLEEQSK